MDVVGLEVTADAGGAGGAVAGEEGTDAKED